MQYYTCVQKYHNSEKKSAEASTPQSAGETDLANMLVIAKRIDELEDMLAETTAQKDRLVASNERHTNTIDSMSTDRYDSVTLVVSALANY